APGGTTADDAVRIATRLRTHGCDAITVSTGQTVPYQKPVYGRLYQTPFSDRIRHEAGIPTMTVGNLSTYADANSILAAGRTSACLPAATSTIPTGRATPPGTRTTTCRGPTSTCPSRASRHAPARLR